MLRDGDDRFIVSSRVRTADRGDGRRRHELAGFERFEGEAAVRRAVVLSHGRAADE
jgi:hypothetical protein